VANRGGPELPSALDQEPDNRSLFDPDTWEGGDAATQALIDGQKPVRQRDPRTAAYYDIIGPAPRCGPGEASTARVYLAKILKALELGGWTHAEYVGLKRLEKTWRARAVGKDVRFLMVGNYQGRLPREQERRIWDLRMAQRRGVL
jgi:hypothetical protein